MLESKWKVKVEEKNIFVSELKKVKLQLQSFLNECINTHKRIGESQQIT